MIACLLAKKQEETKMKRKENLKSYVFLCLGSQENKIINWTKPCIVTLLSKVEIFVLLRNQGLKEQEKGKPSTFFSFPQLSQQLKR